MTSIGLVIFPDTAKVGLAVKSAAALYDALKRGKHAVISNTYAVWIDWTERQPRYMVAQLLSNGRTTHAATLDDYVSLQNWLTANVHNVKVTVF